MISTIKLIFRTILWATLVDYEIPYSENNFKNDLNRLKLHPDLNVKTLDDRRFDVDYYFKLLFERNKFWNRGDAIAQCHLYFKNEKRLLSVFIFPNVGLLIGFYGGILFGLLLVFNQQFYLSFMVLMLIALVIFRIIKFKQKLKSILMEEFKLVES